MNPISPFVSEQRAAPGFGQARRKEFSMQKRSGTIIVLSMIALAAMGILGSCSRAGESRSGHPPLPEESAMTIEAQQPPAPVTIPAIDTAAPQVFDTATFGLG